MTKPLITLPCTAQELENALHAACDHDGLWDAKVGFVQGRADVDPIFGTVAEVVPPRLVIETETKGETK